MKEAIYTDLRKVEELKAVAVYARDKAQIIYDELTKTGVDFTKNEIFDIWYRTADAEFIKNKIIDKKLVTDPPVMFGMKLSRQKLFDLIEVENMQAILSTYEGLRFEHDGYNVNAVSHLLEIKDGVFTLLVGYEDMIFNQCTLFATSVESQQKAEKLVNMANYLNELDDVLTGDWRREVKIRGLEIVNEKYVPDMREIGHIINP